MSRRKSHFLTTYGREEKEQSAGLSVTSDSAIPWTVARQAPLSMESLHARTLEGVAMPSSRGSSQTRDQTQVSHIAGGFVTS